MEISIIRTACKWRPARPDGVERARSGRALACPFNDRSSANLQRVSFRTESNAHADSHRHGPLSQSCAYYSHAPRVRPVKPRGVPAEATTYVKPERVVRSVKQPSKLCSRAGPKSTLSMADTALLERGSGSVRIGEPECDILGVFDTKTSLWHAAAGTRRKSVLLRGFA
jgi:hypothetical protein